MWRLRNQTFTQSWLQTDFLRLLLFLKQYRSLHLRFFIEITQLLMHFMKCIGRNALNRRIGHQLFMQWTLCFQSIRWRCCCCYWLRLGSLRCWTERSSWPMRGAPSREHTSWPNTWTTSWRRSETLTWVTLCLCVCVNETLLFTDVFLWMLFPDCLSPECI